MVQETYYKKQGDDHELIANEVEKSDYNTVDNCKREQGDDLGTKSKRSSISGDARGERSGGSLNTVQRK